MITKKNIKIMLINIDSYFSSTWVGVPRPLPSNTATLFHKLVLKKAN